MPDNEPCEVCGRPTGGCCAVPDNEPKKKFKVVRLPAPEVEVFRIDVEAILRVWAREAFKEAD
jgi:hypothetical protein